MIGKLWPDSNCWCWGASCLSHAIWMRWSFTRPRASQKASAGFRSTPSQVYICTHTYIIIYYMLHICDLNWFNKIPISPLSVLTSIWWTCKHTEVGEQHITHSKTSLLVLCQQINSCPTLRQVSMSIIPMAEDRTHESVVGCAWLM